MLNRVKTVPKLRIQSVNHALCTRVVVAPIRTIQMIQTHGSAAAGCMHEASIADIDTDVADLPATAEKHQVAGRELARFDFRALVSRQGAGRARQLLAEHVVVDVIDQSAAVETR